MRNRAKRTTILAVFGIFFFHLVVADEERYICAPDKATGFKYGQFSTGWDYARLKTGGPYVISRSDGAAPPFVIRNKGEEGILARCCDEPDVSGILRCGSMNGVFQINLNNGRFVRTQHEGYVRGDAEVTPFVEIGTCLPY